MSNTTQPSQALEAVGKDSTSNNTKIITDHLDIWTAAIKKKSATGRGSSKKTELYGIKKLRELILELAVRGKLVPQDPTDEPASVLLKRIAAEKAQLVKDKKIKKPKVLPEIAEDEKPFALPEGWEWCRVIDITNYINGFAFKSSSFKDKGVGIVKIGDISSSGELTPRTMSRVDESVIANLDDNLKVETGDLVIAMSGATTGKLGFNNTKEVFYLNQRVGKFAAYQIDIHYLYLPLTTKIAENLAKSTGSAIPNLSTAQINEIVIALPPLEEQHRIVAKVDELMLLCDQLEQQTESNLSAHNTLVEVLLTSLTDSKNADELKQNWARISEFFDILFTTEHSIEQLKQTILQLAVMGKLVPQDPSNESASKLLERVAEEKAQLIKDKKIKKQKPLPVITDEEKPFELPNDWEWVKFGNVTITRLGKMLDKAKNTGTPLPYLRNTNVQWHRFELADIKKMKIEDKEMAEFKVEKGDLLICEGGEPGRCAIWNNEVSEMYFQKALHRARPLGSVLGKYLLQVLTLDAKNGTLDKYFTGATIKHFVGAKLNNYIIPLPPLEEQPRIVAKVDELMALCDQLKTRLADAQITQLHLADAIIDKAI